VHPVNVRACVRVSGAEPVALVPSLPRRAHGRVVPWRADRAELASTRHRPPVRAWPRGILAPAPSPAPRSGPPWRTTAASALYAVPVPSRDSTTVITRVSGVRGADHVPSPVLPPSLRLPRSLPRDGAAFAPSTRPRGRPDQRAFGPRTAPSGDARSAFPVSPREPSGKARDVSDRSAWGDRSWRTSRRRHRGSRKEIGR
jgi:hypothetical protein